MFSILIPTYNHAQYLSAAIDSVLAQTFPDWEAIIVNDGSTDATADVMETYTRKDPRIRGFHKANGGVASALNLGLQHAQGDWICWLSSDDLFDPRKLDIHQEWIRTHPNCRFFFSLFRYLDESTGQLTEPPLWGKGDTEPQWQILEMLRCIYVHGNSICIQRDAWRSVGMFDETLRYGQDYDMWLRLLAKFPAVFIPERTCITRFHAQQTTNTFPDATYFDSAKAAINFLNQHSFEQLVPLVDLSQPELAYRALAKAINLAAKEDAFLYKLGHHPALLFRIAEWLWNQSSSDNFVRLRTLIRQRAADIQQRDAGTLFAWLWRAMAVAMRLPRRPFSYEPISPVQIAENRYWELVAAGSPAADQLRCYLERFEQIHLSPNPIAQHGASQEIVMVLQRGQTVSDVVKYGSLRATFETAKYFTKSGRRVLLIGLSPQNIGWNEGILYLGIPHDHFSGRVAQYWGNIETFIGLSRADIIHMAAAQRYVIYHHNPFEIDGHLPAQTLNKCGVHVICVSQHSRKTQQQYGIRDDRLHMVYNGVNFESFQMPSVQQRSAHSIVYVGHIIAYKGFDIALQAFIRIQQAYPDAIFHVYGAVRSPLRRFASDFPSGWFDQDGYPVWASIENDLPGFEYCGEVSQTELGGRLGQYSILVMPSRIPETFGIASVEAQACGCLPILPRLGGFPETMREGETGYLYEPNTPETLAKTILDLWNADLPTETQRTAAQTWVRETFFWEKTGASLLEIIASISRQPFEIRVNYYPILWQWNVFKSSCRELSARIRKRRKKRACT